MVRAGWCPRNPFLVDCGPLPTRGIRTVRPIRVLLAVSAAALVAAACGDDSTSGSGSPAQAGGSSTPSAAASSSAAGSEIASLEATEILTRARAAFTKAESVRLTGGGASAGESFTVDMRYGADKAIGTVSNNGQKIELRRIGQTVYLRADKAFWAQTAGAAAAELLGGKYLKAPVADKRVAQLASFTDKDEFGAEVLDPEGKVTKGQTKTIRGVPAIGLDESSGADSGTLYVATTGEPVPLQVAPKAGSSESGSLEFLDYGKSVDVEVPPAAQTIDVTKLGN